MDLVLATNNIKKLDEMQRILEPLNINVLTAKKLGIDLPDVEETGTTFEENAKIKALSALHATNLPAVADDSGLMVDYLGGAPGVYSARFSGEHGNDEKNNELLLKKLAGVPESERGAHYISAICCVFPDGREISVRGECSGKIGFECDGTGGFGYDPLFIINGRTFARYTPKEKDAVSHRGRALRLFAGELKKMIENEG
ncbi:MAG: RdgB/HAM1 family non-canonical purine NTP pyrophosphatase [Clostridiales bacterium]|nr:RdgB/HAM1 family non-canonical purine NTP pyrophosphatase [Clostridiales bacterium]